MEHIKLTWVTPDYFADCDINVVPQLPDKGYTINWIIVLSDNSRYKEQDFLSATVGVPNVNLDFLYLHHRLRSPLNIVDTLKLVRKINNGFSDVIYVNMVVMTPWDLLLYYSLPPQKTILTAHQGQVHLGMAHKKITTFLRDRVYGRFKYINLFSNSQSQLFEERYSGKRKYVFYLGLKDFGRPKNIRPSNGPIRFLSFGTINYTKSIETIIDAAELLYKRGINNFRVIIKGVCKDWSWYQRRIKHPECFEIDVRMIDNSEIPNLFNGSHYFVQPYRVVSQSGPMKIAFNYNLPDITSDLPGFTDELVEDINGYTFKTGNPESLADKMGWVIEHHKEKYPVLLKRMKKYTVEHYSNEKLIQQYVTMFKDVAATHD